MRPTELKDFQAYPAPAKLNLFLHITGRRADGYHLLQTTFQLLDHHDTIYLKPRSDGIIQRVGGNPDVPEEQDLCIRAARLLQKSAKSMLGADLAIEKRIPMGGGLGGGSSDAATVLLALNRLWKLNLSRQYLLKLGLELGADVPVFIFGQNAWAEGIGEELQAISLPERYFYVLTPRIHVSTAQVFSSEELTRNTNPTTIAAFSEVATRKEPNDGLFHNDLQSLVCQNYPEVANCLKFLNQFGEAKMTGSGASVFVELSSESEAELIQTEINKKPELLAGFEISGFTAYGLSQHPLYNFAD